MVDFTELAKKRIVYEAPGMEQVRVVENRVYKTVDGLDLLLDIYYPEDLQAGEKRPAVLLVHGLGRFEMIKHIKNSGQYTSWGRLIAAQGLIAVTFNHRSPDEHVSLSDVANDVDVLVEHVRTHAEELQIDKDTLAICAYSAGVPLGTRSALLNAPEHVKCVVSYYGPLDLQAIKDDWRLTDQEVAELSAITYLRENSAKLPPMLITKAGIDHPTITTSIDSFIAEASAKNITLDYMTHPAGQHAFDLFNNVERSREIIKRTLEFLKTHLTSI